MYKRYLLLILLLCCGQGSATNFAFYGLHSTPAAYKNGDVVEGYYADILLRVAEELGLNGTKIDLSPYLRLRQILNNNEDGVVITCLFPSESFNDRVHQPSAVAYFRTGIISLQSVPLTWDNIQGKKIATIRGASKEYGDKFDHLVKSNKIELVSVNSYEQAIKMLNAGRFDAFAGNLGLLSSIVEQNNLDISEPLIITNKISMITISIAPNIPNGSEIVAEISTIVDDMRSSGELQNLIEQYLPEAKQPRH